MREIHGPSGSSAAAAPTRELRHGRSAPPPGLHPDPAVPPVGIALRVELTAELRWMAGDVFPGGRCHSAATVRVSFGAATLGSPLAGQIRGPAAGATFGQARLVPDPRLRP